MPSLTGLGISLPFPGTAVPGYRLFRPYGTGPVVPSPFDKLRAGSTGLGQPGWTSCHSTAGAKPGSHYRRQAVFRREIRLIISTPKHG